MENVNYTFTVTAVNAITDTTIQTDRPQSAQKIGQFTIVEDPPEFRGSFDVTIDEGQSAGTDLVIGNIGQYLVSSLDPADRYTIEIFGVHPPGTPKPAIRIAANGDIILVGGAPLVDQNSTFWADITAYNEGGIGKFVANFQVRAERPLWGALPNQSDIGGDPIRVELDSSYITNYAKSHSVTDPIDIK